MSICQRHRDRNVGEAAWAWSVPLCGRTLPQFGDVNKFPIVERNDKNKSGSAVDLVQFMIKNICAPERTFCTYLVVKLSARRNETKQFQNTFVVRTVLYDKVV